LLFTIQPFKDTTMSHSATSTTSAATDPLITVYEQHSAAESAIKALSKAGFDIKKLSIVGKGYHTEEHAVGFYTTGDRIKTWGGIGSFWGAIWGTLSAPAVFMLPPLGLVAVAGPFVVTLLAALEGAVLGGGFSALGAALYGMGTSKDRAIKYEADVKADRFLVMVHGTEPDIARAKSVLTTLAESMPKAGALAPALA
jgi:hypothetical protein